MAEEAPLSSQFVDAFVNSAFGTGLSQIQPLVFISRRVRLFAFLSSILPLALVPEVLLPYPNEQWTVAVFLITFTIFAFFRILMLRLRLTLIHRRTSRYSRQSAILFLSAISFADIIIFWTTATGYYVGLAVAAIVAAFGFAITQVRLPMVREPTDKSLQ